MKSALRKVSLNGGIVSPYLDGRIDLARYQSGCLESTNQIPANSGISVTRPGLVYDERLDRVTVLVPYVVSSSTSYLLAFSDLELRIISDGSIVQDGGGDLVITTPYVEADLYELKVDSLVDVLWIAHENYPPHQLTRTSPTDWEFIELPYLNPPMIPRAGEDQLLTPSATTGTGITITSDADLFNADHVGSYWRIGHKLEAGSIDLALDDRTDPAVELFSDWLRIDGDWAFTTSGNWRGDIIIYRRDIGDAGDGEKIRDFKNGSDARNIATTGTEDGNVELRIGFTNRQPANTGAPTFNPHATIEVTNTNVYGLVKITGYTDEQTVTADVIVDLPASTETSLWEEGAWSDHRGYPSVVALFERRLMFAASTAFPNRYWSSYQDDRQDYELGEETQSAMSFDLPARDVIAWMLSERQLLIGSRREEVVLSSGRDDLPLSPSNSIARVNGSIGSSRVQAIKSSGAILYAERRGRRIRELFSDPATDGLANTDVSAFAPHLFDANVLQMAAGQLDQKLVFVLLSNRKLLCINHDRDQEMGSWFVIETKGDFESVAALPGDLSEDVVYVITRRTIDGVEHRQLEHFAVDQWDLIEDGETTEMVYSDMAKTVDLGTPGSVVTGLEDWEGEEVQILADGAIQPNQTVESGQISLTVDSTIVTLGLPYSSSFTPMWFEDLQQPTQGRLRKVSQIYFSMYNGGNVTVQATDEGAFGELESGEQLLAESIPRRNSTDPYGSPPQLENNYFKASIESRHSRKQSVRFERNSPLPMIIQNLHTIYNAGDK